jgi:enamine deaminase RidA (YjgF/YER057c/UK114 family)
MSIRRIEVGPRMSQAVVHGNTVYLAGQVAADTSGDTTAQTTVILGQIDRVIRRPVPPWKPSWQRRNTRSRSP